MLHLVAVIAVINTNQLDSLKLNHLIPKWNDRCSFQHQHHFIQSQVAFMIAGNEVIAHGGFDLTQRSNIVSQLSDSAVHQIAGQSHNIGI